MNKNNNMKTGIWTYAVILFTSAFVVLLLTAYSQIKFNDNIENYKFRISSNENEKNVYRLNLNTALSENNQLKENASKLNNKISALEKNLKSFNEEISELKKFNKDIQDNYESLLSAQNEYDSGHIRKSAELLFNKVNVDILNDEGKVKYYKLSEIVNKKAALELYNEGYKLYKKGQYSDAVKNFELSHNYWDKEYFADDCLYFLIYSQYYLGNSDQVKSYADVMTEKFSKSSLTKEIFELLKKYN